jgi:hypothetical protein
MNRKSKKLGVLLFSLLLVAGLTACGGGGGTGDATPVVISISPSDGSVILKGQTIVITFSESMDTIRIDLDGTLDPESDGGQWSTTNVANDTLTISPKTEWSVDVDQWVSVEAQDLASNKISPLRLTYHIVHDIVYVSTPANSGNDANPGTQSEPKATINAAIDKAVTLQSALPPTSQPPDLYAVFVSEGNYTVDSAGGSGNHVILMNGISLLGGYSADFSERDPASHVTRITDTSTAAASSHLNPNRAVETEGAIDTPTLLDGLTIKGSDQGNYSAAIYINGGGLPTIQNNMILGGGTDVLKPSLFSMGIVNFSGQPTIRNNTITGGMGERVSIGVLSAGASSYTIENNTIDGGNGGRNSYGVWSTVESSASSIRNNTIHGGSPGESSFGIQNEGASPTIQNNTINGGSGLTFSYGIQNTRFIPSGSPSSPTIDNNIIFTTGPGSEYCIHEADVLLPMEPVSLRNNDLFGCGTALYFDEAANNLISIADVNALTDTTASGNISIDPVFVNLAGGDWHLTPSSPPAVTQGGLDLSPAFTIDKDGKARTAPWSIGAYELD